MGESDKTESIEEFCDKPENINVNGCQCLRTTKNMEHVLNNAINTYEELKRKTVTEPNNEVKEKLRRDIAAWDTTRETYRNNLKNWEEGMPANRRGTWMGNDVCKVGDGWPHDPERNAGKDCDAVFGPGTTKPKPGQNFHVYNNGWYCQALCVYTDKTINEKVDSKYPPNTRPKLGDPSYILKGPPDLNIPVQFNCCAQSIDVKGENVDISNIKQQCNQEIKSQIDEARGIQRESGSKTTDNESKTTDSESNKKTNSAENEKGEKDEKDNRTSNYMLWGRIITAVVILLLVLFIAYTLSENSGISMKRPQIKIRRFGIKRHKI